MILIMIVKQAMREVKTTSQLTFCQHCASKGMW